MASAVRAAFNGWRRPITVLLALAIVPLGAPLPITAAAEPVASDAFTRSTSGGWGTAELGGTYALEGNAANFSVAAGVGNVVLPAANANRAANLPGVQVRDVEATVRVSANKRPTGGSLFVYLPARRIGTSAFRPKVILHPNGTVSAHAGIVINNSESPLGPAVVVSGLTHTANTYIRVRTLVSGVNPTTISVRAWADGAAEPAIWHFSATNSNAALQQPGAVGMRAYLNSSVTNAPLSVAFDDLLVESHDAPPPPPAPTANFDWSQAAESLDVQFTDQSTADPTEWLWDFGDGATSVEQNPSHTYAAPGSYSVTLTATNAAGSDADVLQIDVVEPGSGPTIVAGDSFDRTRSGSWGVADTGGLYSYQGALADFNVTGGGATLRLPNAGATRSAFLFSVLADEVSISFSVATSKAASGGPMFIYAALRRTTAGLAYRPKLRIDADGSVFAHAGRLGASGETSLGPEVRVPGLSHAADQRINVRAQATGSNPTTVRIRAWADGQPEPDIWHFSAFDSLAALQGPGAVGVLSHVHSSATNAPVVMRFDDLLATTSDPVERVTGETFVGAGDISLCSNNNDEATSILLDQIEGTVFTAGDNAQDQANAAEFANCYNPTWGRHAARTHPALGNHEYHSSADAAPYFDYFGTAAAGPIGERAKGWYAYDVGTWRVYALNSNCGFVGCTAGSEQEQWLRADLAANPRECSIAIWHHPRYSSGATRGSHTSVQPFWQALYEAGAELVVSGHDHDYERFAPIGSAGQADVTGIRQFVVGTGGASLRPTFSTILPASEIRQATSFGVLKLTLGSGAYEWEFIPIAGQTFTDRGSGTCH